ncbi:MAG: hypothetical protein PHC68_18940 [Syntrophorhabdaceae bacterium]|nr:hypothetical protein [Syntrophorhabdaceae bacterium]
MIQGLPKLNGVVIYYKDKNEMETVYKRLKDLNLPEVEVKKSWDSEQGTLYPWVIAFIRKDEKNSDKLDEYLTENKIDIGKLGHICTGEPGILDFFGMLPLDGKFPSGLAKIAAGECPINAKSAMACTFCHFGHLLECHHPMTCEQAQCSHCQREADY